MTADQLLLVDLRPRRIAGWRIPGDPVRAKHACTCVGKHGRTYPLEAWREWRDAVVPLLRSRWRRPPIDLPVRARVDVVFRRPATPRRTHLVREVELPYPYEWTDGRVGFVGTPDWDQVYKAATDVLVHAGILLDDRLIRGPHGGDRWYAARAEGPCVEVSLWTAP
jgi:Holliday junction resolvase RusA-like endonuclease